MLKGPGKTKIGAEHISAKRNRLEISGTYLFADSSQLSSYQLPVHYNEL